MYGTVARVKALTGVQPVQLDQADAAALDALLTAWLEEATSAINGFLQRDLEAEAGNTTTLAQAAATDAEELKVASAAKIGIGDGIWVGSGITREWFATADVDRSTNVISLAGALRYDHAQGETVGRSGVGTAIPAAVHGVAERLVANLIGLAVQRRSTPIVNTSDFTVQLSSDAVFTQALKNDLRHWRRRPGFFLA